jgi:hypothetical protein
LDGVLIISLILHLFFLTFLPDITRLNLLYEVIGLVCIKLLRHSLKLGVDKPLQLLRERFGCGQLILGIDMLLGGLI